MNYRNKIVGITGSNGFLGRELADKLTQLGANVIEIEGDTRDEYTFDQLDFTYDYLFHFAAPSSQILFKRQPAYCIETTLKGFMNAAEACRKHGIKLIYPSTGVLSQGGTNEYAQCKQICENYHLGSKLDALGLRIFATYGPQESHKRDFASVPYLFARDVVDEKRPVVYGDGEQTRDFVYITDCVNAILTLAEEASEPIVDIGSGVSTSFNQILHTLSNVVEHPIDTVHVDTPTNYVKETHADISTLTKYYTPATTIEEGLQAIVASLR